MSVMDKLTEALSVMDKLTEALEVAFKAWTREDLDNLLTLHGITEVVIGEVQQPATGFYVYRVVYTLREVAFYMELDVGLLNVAKDKESMVIQECMSAVKVLIDEYAHKCKEGSCSESI